MYLHIARVHTCIHIFRASQIRRRRRRRLLSARPSRDRRRDRPKGLANMNASHYACTDLSCGRKVGISEPYVTSRRCIRTYTGIYIQRERFYARINACTAASRRHAAAARSSSREKIVKNIFPSYVSRMRNDDSARASSISCIRIYNR